MSLPPLDWYRSYNSMEFHTRHDSALTEDNRRCIFCRKYWYELYWNGLIWFFTPQNIGIATKIILIPCVVTEIFIKTTFSVMAVLICLLEHKIFLWSRLKRLNLIMYPTKCRDRHQNYYDTLYNYQDIDENKIFSNGGLNLHIRAQNICVSYTKMAEFDSLPHKTLG